MPRSHICTECLTELARVPATRDPRSGLPVVVCPSCAAPCVRVRNPVTVFWRRSRTLYKALRGLALLALMLGMLVIITNASASFIAEHDLSQLASVQWGHLTLLGRAAALLTLIVFAALIRIKLPHQHAGAVLAIIASAAFAPIAIAITGDTLCGVLEPLIGGDCPWEHDWRFPLEHRMQGLAASMIPIGLGVVIGHALMPLARRAARRRLSRRRRKIRSR